MQSRFLKKTVNLQPHGNSLLSGFRESNLLKKKSSSEFTKDELSKLNEVFKSPLKIAYLSESEEKVIVRLTKKGYKLYCKKILSGRPAYIEKKNLPDSEKPFLYELTFICSEMQAYQYFIRLGKEVETIAPANLRNGFKQIHETAVKYYK